MFFKEKTYKVSLVIKPKFMSIHGAILICADRYRSVERRSTLEETDSESDVEGKRIPSLKALLDEGFPQTEAEAERKRRGRGRVIIPFPVVGAHEAAILYSANGSSVAPQPQRLQAGR